MRVQHVTNWTEKI